MGFAQHCAEGVVLQASVVQGVTAIRVAREGARTNPIIVDITVSSEYLVVPGDNFVHANIKLIDAFREGWITYVVVENPWLVRSGKKLQKLNRIGINPTAGDCIFREWIADETIGCGNQTCNRISLAVGYRSGGCGSKIVPDGKDRPRMSVRLPLCAGMRSEKLVYPLSCSASVGTVDEKTLACAMRVPW